LREEEKYYRPALGYPRLFRFSEKILKKI